LRTRALRTKKRTKAEFALDRSADGELDVGYLARRIHADFRECKRYLGLNQQTNACESLSCLVPAGSMPIVAFGKIKL